MKQLTETEKLKRSKRSKVFTELINLENHLNEWKLHNIKIGLKEFFISRIEKISGKVC